MTNWSHASLLLISGVLLGACGGQLGPRAAQSISFAELPVRSKHAVPFEVAAQATSGLTVTFEAVGVCTGTGTTVALTGALGDCTITASQAGDKTYLPAPDVARSFAVIDDVDRVGFVLVTETGPVNARTVDASGSFEVRMEPVTDLLASAPLGDGTATCLVTSVISSGPGDPVLPGSDPTATGIDAGALLAVRHDGAFFASLVSEEVGVYALDESAPRAAPLPSSGLTLDVPGTDFAAFTGAAFVPTAPFELDAGFDTGNVTVDSIFTWSGAAGGDSVALLIGGDANAVFSCVVPDDGDFAFADATRGALAAQGFVAGSLFAAGRLSLAPHHADDSLLLLGVLLLESYGHDPAPTAVETMMWRALTGLPGTATGAAR